MELKEKLEVRLQHLKPILEAGGKSIEIIFLESPMVTFAVKGFCSGCECTSSYKQGLQDLVHETCPELTEIIFTN